MAVTDQQKIDFLLKKIGFTKTKTGSVVGTGAISGTPKQPFAEAIPSPLIIANDSLWNESASIPATAPTSDTAQVKVYLAGTSGLRMTADPTSSGQRAYIAHTTYNNTSSARLNNWIDTQFGSSYLIKVFRGDPNSGGVQLSAAGSGNNDGWFFDYSAGILNFNDTNVPSGVTDTNIYIVGYRYIGLTGAPTPTGAGNFTFNDVTVTGDLDVDGHTNLDNVSIAGVTTATGLVGFGTHITLEDYGQIQLGEKSGGDLKIYHDPTMFGGVYNVIESTNGNFFFVNKDTTNKYMYIRSNDIQLRDWSNNHAYIHCIMGGEVELYYANQRRFETTNTGIDVTGNVVSDGLVVDGDTNLDNVNIAGVSTFAGNVDINADIDVDGHAEFDNISVSGVTTSIGTFHIRPSSGALSPKISYVDSIADALIFADNVEARFGGSSDFRIYHETPGDLNIIETHNDRQIHIRELDGTNIAKFIPGGSVELYHSGTKHFETASSGVNIVGTTTSTQLAITGISTFTGAIDANGDLDVDGHTNLDNVSIAGVTTFASTVNLGDNDRLNFYDTNTTIYGNSIGLNIESSGGKDIIIQSNSSGGTSSDFIVKSSGSELLKVNGDGGVVVTGILTATSFSGPLTGNVTGNVSGNAGTATALQTARNIGGVSFDGTSDIDLPGVNIAGNQDTSGTAAGLSGSPSINITNLTAVDGTFSGNVSIGGTLTYEDVTNIDSVGLITARSGIFLPDSQKVQFGNVAGNADLEIYHDGNHSYISDQGTGQLKILTSTLSVKSTDDLKNALELVPGSYTKLFFDGSKKFETAETGAVVTGILTVSQDLDVDGHTNLDNVSIAGITTFSGIIDAVNTPASIRVAQDIQHKGDADTKISFPSADTITFDTAGTTRLNIASDGNISVTNDIDVDGHTDLDNVSIAGVSTFNDDVTFTSANGNNILFDKSDNALEFGNGVKSIYNGNLEIYNDGSNRIKSSSGGITIAPAGSFLVYDSSFTNLRFEANSAHAILYGGGAKVARSSVGKFEVGNPDAGVGIAATMDISGNAQFIGIVTASSFRGDGSQLSGISVDASALKDSNGNVKIQANESGAVHVGISTFQDIDVDGHTNLDNVSIAGVTTITSNVLYLKSASGSGPTISAITGSDVLNISSNGFIVKNQNGWKGLEFTGSSIELYSGQMASHKLVLQTNSSGVALPLDLDVDGHTELDNVNVAGITTFNEGLFIPDDKKIKFGNTSASPDFEIFHSSDYNDLKSNNGNIRIRNYDTSGSGKHIYIQSENVQLRTHTNNHSMISAFAGAQVELYYNNAKRLETSSVGVSIPQDLDVDGHTELDNVNVAGITTFNEGLFIPDTKELKIGNSASNPDLKIWNNTASTIIREENSNLDIQASFLRIADTSGNYKLMTNGTGVSIPENLTVSGDLDVDGHTNLDNVSIAGVSTFSDDVTFVGAAGTDATWVKDRNALSLEKYAKIEFGDFIGNDRKFRIFDEGTSKILSSNVLTIQSTLSDVRLTASLGDITLSSDNVILKPLVGGNVLKTSDTTAFLYYSGSEKLKTTSTGVFVTGILTTTDLDVDGHTNLDNVSVAGVTTFTGAAEFDSDVRFDSTITAGGGTGNNGQYLKSTGHGVAWESFPTMRTTTTVTASAGQTTFSFTYNVGFLDVFINGTKLTDSEFTATNGSSVVLAVGCFVGDIVELVSYNTVSGGGGSGAGSITVQDEGSSLSTGAETLNFVGTGVVASGTGPTKTITINTGTADTSNVTTNNLNVVGFSTFARSLLMKENQRINLRDANTAIYHQTNFNIESAGSGGDIILKTNAAGGNSNDVVLHGGSVGELLRAHGTGDVDIINTLGIGGSITKASGHLDIRASNLSLKNANNSATYASFTDGGSAELNHNNTKRLETLSNGVNVIGSLFVNGSAIGGGGGGSGYFSQTVSGIHTLSNVGIGTADPEFDLDLGSYTSQNVSTASTIRIMGDGASSANTAIRFGAGGNNVDYTLLRVDGQDGTTDGDGNTDLGFALRYMSAGESGTDNRLAFWADNTTKTKYEALSIYNDGRVLVDNGASGGHGFHGHPPDHFTVRGSSKLDNIRVVGVSTFQNVLPQTDSTYDIGTNTVRFRNIYADNLYGDGSNLTGISGGGGSNVGITTNLSGNFTATPGSPSTINTLSGYSSDDLVIEYTIYIKNGSNIQTQKLLAMRDGTTIDSTQFAVMFSSSLLAQFDATISSGDILLRATPESGITGNTTYKIKREVM